VKKFQDLLPDDPNSWYDMNGFWPTDRQSYESADGLSTVARTATGCGTPLYAFSARAVGSGTYDPIYVVDSAKIWQYNADTGTASDRTGTAVIPAYAEGIQFIQYGDNTVACLGVDSTPPSGSPVYVGKPTQVATNATTNFAALANAPQAVFGCVVSNVLLLFNTQANGGGAVTPDGWAASDVFDITNWTTGDAANGRLLSTPGALGAAVSFRDAAYVFKVEGGGIYRMNYVGGDVKWMTKLEWTGFGCPWWKMAKAGKDGILFYSDLISDTSPTTGRYYWYDGVNKPVLTNPFTSVPSPTQTAGESCIDYDPTKNLFHVYTGNGVVYYFNPESFAWGKYDAGVADFVVIDGGKSSGMNFVGVNKSAANTLRFYFPATPSTPCYVQTTKYGRPDKKTKFMRATPILRRRVDNGTDSVSCEFTLFREREDTSATKTRTVTEDTKRKRFDLQSEACTDNFARLKFTYTNIDAEIDDVMVESADAGTN
jgi:hypothetical protein